MSSAASIDVLLIEDDAEEAELALRALRTACGGVRAVCAASGAEALALLGGAAPGAGGFRTMPRVILLDLKLPNMDGFQILERLKSDLATRTIPVVILTSSQLESDIRGSYELGANGYVVKSFDYGKFSDMMAGFSRYWLNLNMTPAL